MIYFLIFKDLKLPRFTSHFKFRFNMYYAYVNNVGLYSEKGNFSCKQTSLHFTFLHLIVIENISRFASSPFRPSFRFDFSIFPITLLFPISRGISSFEFPPRPALLPPACQVGIDVSKDLSDKTG